jgi:glycosyltransferase involved in cell wall biosynthesis
MPAYNAARTLKATVDDIPKNCFNEIILVDDCSTDGTVAVAKKLGLTVIEHKKNKGYGANQKSCYDIALEKKADVIVMLHPDYQYDGRLIPSFVDYISKDVCDIILGNRIRSRKEALRSKMPFYKYLSNRFLTIIENMVLGQNLGDFHSGFRCYHKSVLESIPYKNNSDDFVFDTQFLAQAAYFNFTIADAPIPCRYFQEASSINFLRSCKYGLLTLYTMMQFTLQKIKIGRFKIFAQKK